MLHHLDTIESALIQSILKLAMQKTGQTLADWMQEEIDISQLVFKEILDFHHFFLSDADTQNYYVLASRVVGELSAESFLILNEQNAHSLWNVILQHKSDVSPEMQTAILLETDNILTASAVVVLSELLSLKIYGDVPQMYLLNTDELRNFLAEELNHFDFSMTCQTQIQSRISQVNLDFIWGFQSDLINLIKEPLMQSQINQKITQYQQFFGNL